MPIAEILLASITDAVIGQVIDKGGERVGASIKKALGLDPIKKAFQEALKEAFQDLQQENPEWEAAQFNLSFFQHEGAPILAQLLLRDGNPDSYELAECWADSINMPNSEQRILYMHNIEPVAAKFLHSLAQNLKSKPELSAIYNGRALELLTNQFQSLLDYYQADKATPGTRRDYLQWMVHRMLYLDPRGTFQTQRQVQVKLDDVYISLNAQSEENPAIADRFEARLEELSEQKADGLISAEEMEDQLEELHLKQTEKPTVQSAVHIKEVVELSECVRHHSHLVILGDPGSGKSTLLRFLSLKHAHACLYHKEEAGKGLGSALFPIFVRIAEYAEDGKWRKVSLSDFLAVFHKLHECPAKGLNDLLKTELEVGQCLILFDGLDEIVNADERRAIVSRIENFVQRYSTNGNRFVITSRIAGYRSASLSAPFAHYIVRDMDEEQIQYFLERWCRAVEEAQTPELPVQEREKIAQREINGIMEAVRRSSGVRRLAVNPLLLRTLALIHRTGAQLPQKRIELYKLAADTLSRTWRTAQGVPESALVKDEYLTPLLSKFAYWLHVHKPSGIVTEGDVYKVMGEEWARQNELPWNVEQPLPKIREEVSKFLLAVREHTGLFVERAPKRYGFMHLTFEEYYVARYLVSSSKERAKRIRQHLHDSRWEEPILLGLGFVGMEYPTEARELVETSILAQGEEAQSLKFQSSKHEEILGRDFLFALRCIGDQIPIRPKVQAQCFVRSVEALVYHCGPARFERFREALNMSLLQLAGSESAIYIQNLLLQKLQDTENVVRLRAANALWQLGQSTPEVVAGLVGALHDPAVEVRFKVIEILAQLKPKTPEVIAGLMEVLQDSDTKVRLRAANTLWQLGQSTPEVVAELAVALHDQPVNRRRRIRNAALLELEPKTPEVIAGLMEVLHDPGVEMRLNALVIIRRLKQKTPEMIAGLMEVLHDPEVEVRLNALVIIRQLEPKTPEVIAGLVDALHDPEVEVRFNAVVILGQLKQKTPKVIAGLVDVFHDPDAKVRSDVASTLGELGQKTPEVIAGLVDALHDPDAKVRFRAASILGELGQKTLEVIAGLVDALHDPDAKVRSDVASTLGELGQKTPEVIAGLVDALHDPDAEVRFRAAESLLQLGQYVPEAIAELVEALYDPDADADGYIRAVDSLWQLGQKTPEVIAGLVDALHDPNAVVRSDAVVILGRLGQYVPEVIAGLVDALHDPDAEVRSKAIESLGLLEQNISGKIEGLVEVLYEPATEERSDVVSALEQVEQSSRKIIAGLMEVLHDPDAKVRSHVIRSLGELKPSTPEVVAELVEALHDPEVEVRSKAIESLGHLGWSTPEVIAGLVEALHDPEVEVRSAVIWCLGLLEPRTPEVIAGLVEALHNPEAEVRSTAAMTLGELEPSAPEMIAGLVEALHDPEAEVRSDVIRSLERLNQRTPEVIAGLVEALHDPEAEVRLNAIGCLGQLEKSTPEVVAGLVEALHDPEAEVRLRAAESLLQLGQYASEAIAELVEVFSKSKEWYQRRRYISILSQNLLQEDRAILKAVWDGFLDESATVRRACARALVHWNSRFPTSFKRLETRLISALKNPSFEKLDDAERPAFDYVYDVLWQIMIGEVVLIEDDELGNLGDHPF